MRKYHVDIDSFRYPRDGVSIEHASNNYLNQYRDLKLIHKECVGEKLLNHFVSYADMKNKYSIQVIHLRFQVGHINPKENQLHQESRGATNIARSFMILFRHREIELISD